VSRVCVGTCVCLCEKDKIKENLSNWQVLEFVCAFDDHTYLCIHVFVCNHIIVYAYTCIYAREGTGTDGQLIIIPEP